MHKKDSSFQSLQIQPTAAVIGARGYSGLELVRILLNHPAVELTSCFATEAFSLGSYLSNPKAHAVQCYPQSEIQHHKTDVAFLATPAEVSLKLAPELNRNGTFVIDLSGAFRLKNNSYPKWYGFEHTQAPALGGALYGLNPWASPVKPGGSNLIANPGCYATAVLLALLPLLKEGVIKSDSIVVDAKSGTTGGGKKATEGLLFSEVDGECLPYKIGQHQHYPEMQEYIEYYAGSKIDFHFSTSLLPVRRGIIASCFSRLNDGFTVDGVRAAYAKYYADQKMIKFGEMKENPSFVSLKKVVGTNNTFISFTVEQNKLYVFSVIDNLVKGAAGQAVENMNRHFDYPIELGLSQLEALQ